MNVYVPRAGSVAERVLEYLREHGATATRPLADALETDSTTLLSGALDPPVKHGLIVKERRGGLVYWSEGNGLPPAVPDDDEPDKPLRTSANKRPLTDGVPIDRLLHGREPATPPAAQGALPFQCALWSDGRLQLWVGDDGFTLSREHAGTLRSYLGRISEEQG